MIIKLCLNGEIHRVSNTPDSFDALMTYAIRVFKDKMPEVFTFQYPDSDGDMVMLVNEESYKTMLDTESSAASIKIFIVQPGETMSQSSMFRSAMIRSKLPESEGVNLLDRELKAEIQKPILEELKPEPSEQNQILDKEQLQDPRIEDSKNEKEDREPLAGNDASGQANSQNPQSQAPGEAEPKRVDEPQVDMIAMERSRLRDQALQRLNNLKNKSATKIQKIFRGFATRNELKNFAESILQETSHNNPKRNDLIDHPERIIQHKSEVIYPEKPIIENLQEKIQHPHGVHTDVSVIKGALREVFLENIETLTRLVKHEPREVVQESVDNDLISIVKDIVKTYNSLNPFLKEKIDDQFKGGINKLSKHYTKNYENKIQPAPQPEKIKPEPPKVQDKEEVKVEVTDKYDFQIVKEVATLPKVVTTKDSTIYKTVMIKNNGSADWPKGTVLSCIEGLKATECKLSSVNVGKEYTAVLAVTNPGTSGSHKSKWRASYVDDKGKKVFFGSPVTIELFVEGQGGDGGNKKTYSENVMKKAKEMNDVIGGDEKNLYEFVSKNSNLSVSDLLDKFFSG